MQWLWPVKVKRHHIIVDNDIPVSGLYDAGENHVWHWLTYYLTLPTESVFGVRMVHVRNEASLCVESDIILRMNEYNFPFVLI